MAKTYIASVTATHIKLEPFVELDAGEPYPIYETSFIQNDLSQYDKDGTLGANYFFVTEVTIPDYMDKYEMDKLEETLKERLTEQLKYEYHEMKYLVVSKADFKIKFEEE